MNQDRLEQILSIWPRLKKLSHSEKQWLIDAMGRVVDAGASSIEDRFVPRNWDGIPKNSLQDRSQLYDLLAELRIGNDLALRGFSLEYEVPGIGDKTIDFKASIEGMKLWVEVKQLNLDQVSRKFIESERGPVIVTWLKDDVRIGRLITAAAGKMPKNNDSKCVVIFVDNMDEYIVDAKDYLFDTREESARWTSPLLAPLVGVVVTAASPQWPYEGPINMELLTNPKREDEARTIVQKWPMRLYGNHGVSLAGIIQESDHD